jgi:hypothetical protein
MIARREAERITDAYYEVEKMLSEEKDMLFTKEEIYARFPKDNDGVPFITISSLNNALRNMRCMRVIEVVYVRGVCHYGINNRDRR